MIASTPSSTALAASLTSARVGRGSCRIDSSTCVATITGRPSARAFRVISFCIRGTCSSGTSSPRSPRATITASALVSTASRCWRASGRSSFAMMGVPGAWPSVTFLAAWTSAALWTNDSATMSTPRDKPKARSWASFSVSPEAGKATPGALMPLCSPSWLPWTTVVLISVPSVASTRRTTRPSSSSNSRPGVTLRASGASCRVDHAGLPNLVAGHDSQRLASLQGNGCAAGQPARPDSWGPTGPGGPR